MDPRLLFAMQLLNALPSLIEAGIEVKALVESQNAKLKAMTDANREPTAEEWDDLNRTIDGLRGQLHAD